LATRDKRQNQEDQTQNQKAHSGDYQESLVHNYPDDEQNNSQNYPANPCSTTTNDDTWHDGFLLKLMIEESG